MIPIKHANSENNSRQWMIMVHVNNTITTPMNIIISYPTMCPLSSPLLSRTTATRRLLRCRSTFSGRKRYSRKLSISFTRQPIVSTREHLRSKICAMVGSYMSSGCKTPPVGWRVKGIFLPIYSIGDHHRASESINWESRSQSTQ